MRVRLAFSVAAHLEPEILVIDEVLAVGDVNFQKKCLNKMEDIREGYRTILFVSHNLPAITRLCSRTILLDSGKIVADGPTQDVVNLYTKSGDIMKAERHWPVLSKAPGDDVARLVAVRARTDNGSISTKMDIRQPIKLEMEYQVLKDGYEYYIYFQVVNENGILAFTTIENDLAWRARPRPTGNYISYTIIPGNFLSEGIYHIVANMKTLYPWKRRFGSSEHIAFQVVDSPDGDSARVDHAGEIAGVVRPMLKWKTQITPE